MVSQLCKEYRICEATHISLEEVYHLAERISGLPLQAFLLNEEATTLSQSAEDRHLSQRLHEFLCTYRLMKRRFKINFRGVADNLEWLRNENKRYSDLRHDMRESAIDLAQHMLEQSIHPYLAHEAELMLNKLGGSPRKPVLFPAPRQLHIA